MPEDKLRSLTSRDQNGAWLEILFSPESWVCCSPDQKEQLALSRSQRQARPQGPNPQLEGTPASFLKMTAPKATATSGQAEWRQEFKTSSEINFMYT